MRASLFIVLVAGVATIGWLLRSYPNYDGYYALVWGHEIAHFHLPDYAVYRSPTPHPLFNLYAALISLTGSYAVRVMTVSSLVMFLGLIVGAYEMVRLKISNVVAVATVLVLLTRTDLLALGLRSLVDVPFLGLLIWAAVLELARPRRGTAPLVLIALAGLLRPEAWLLAGVYWLWLAFGHPRSERRHLVFLAVLVIAPPVIWLGLDWWIAGDPLYSFLSTREVAGELARQKSLLESLALAPRYVGGNEPVVNGIAGAVGIGLAIYALRSRMFILASLAGVGLLTYLLIAVGGLSVIPRYLLLPSIVACVGVAFALTGWTELEGRSRRLGIAAAVLTGVLMVVRVPGYAHDVEELSTNSAQVRARIGGLAPLLRSRTLRSSVATCRPLLSPTHEAVPVLRQEFGLAKGDVVATTTGTRPKTHGVQLLQAGYLDPVGQTSISDSIVRRLPWAAFPLPGFDFLTTTDSWLVYTHC